MQNNFVELLKELKTTNSVKDKEAILNKYKDDDYVAELLHRNLNPYKMYYIKKLPKITYNPSTPSRSTAGYRDFIKLTDRLNSRIVTGHAAIAEVVAFFETLGQDEFEAYAKVLLKKPIGLGASTVNKVWVDFIPVFDVMKAPTELANLAAIKYPKHGQIKYDGFRAVYLPYEDDLIFGASGLPIRNKRVIDYFKALQSVADYVLDAEIYSHDHSFEQIESVLNSMDKEIPESFVFVVFDAIPVKDWQAKKCLLPYADRLKIVRELVQSTIGDRKKVIDVPDEILESSGEAVEFYKKCLKDGYEGAMLKDPLGLYQWKRVTIKSGEVYKVKPFDSVDVPIVDFYEGEGESNKGTLGGIVVDLGNGLTCNCGSGFTHALGKEIWGNQSKYLGKMVEITFFEYTEEGSLRHPRFKRFRPDKDTQ